MTNQHEITLTPEAAAAIEELKTEQGLEGHSLRIFISGVG